MDPFAHTLVGATLGETGLKKTTPLATTTLVLGANAPDLDFFWSLGDSDHSLWLRRGITHGVVAMAVLPLLLAGLMYGIGMLRTRRGAPPPRFGALFGLSLLSVLTHPALDWMNTYGVRLLMPFDGRWFYGDSFFIIDPWVWLLSASAVVLATTRTKLGAGAWWVLGAGASALVFGFPEIPWGTQVVWCLGVLGIIVLKRPLRTEPSKVARAAVALLTVYALAMIGGGALAKSQVRAFFEERGVTLVDAMAAPLPGNPFAREVIGISEDAYHFAEVRWFQAEPVARTRPPLPRPDREDPVVRAALTQPEIRGFANWVRLLFVDVIDYRGGYRVVLRDLRYARPDEEGFADFAKVVVDLDRDLRPAEGS